MGVWKQMQQWVSGKITAFITMLTFICMNVSPAYAISFNPNTVWGINVPQQQTIPALKFQTNPLLVQRPTSIIDRTKKITNQAVGIDTGKAEADVSNKEPPYTVSEQNVSNDTFQASTNTTSGNISKQTPQNADIIGQPVKSVDDASAVLHIIIQAEGLHPTRIQYMNMDQSGNYIFSVWYKDFPHNIRIVTHDGYVVEDYDG